MYAVGNIKHFMEKNNYSKSEVEKITAKIRNLLDIDNVDDKTMIVSIVIGKIFDNSTAQQFHRDFADNQMEYMSKMF